MGYDANVEVRGIRKPDEEWERMRDVWLSCDKAGLPIPEEVERFFDHKPPDPRGLCVHLEMETHEDGDRTMALSTGGSNKNYYLINVSTIPDHITHIKVWMYQSY